MKYIKRLNYWSGLILFIFSVLFSSVNALAATTTTTTTPTSPLSNNIGEALEIAPPLVYLNANPGQTITTQIQVRDISSGDLLVFGRADDFIAAGTNGDPKILFNDSTTTDPYSMKAWVAPMPYVLLKPEQINNINVTINVPRNASPGGHYGVIRFSATPPSLANKNGVALSASLGTLILLTVSGHLVQNLSLSKFYTTDTSGHVTSFFQSDPITFSEALKNSGNVALQPQGQIVVKDMFNKQLVSMNINPLTDNILPSSTRIFSQTLNPVMIGNKKMFGRYSAYLDLTYGTSNKTIQATVTFWVIPVVPIIILVVAVIVGFFLLRWLIKRYNKHILDKANKSKSK